MAAGIRGHQRLRLFVCVLLGVAIITATVGFVGYFCPPAHAALGAADDAKIHALIYPTLGNPAIIRKGQNLTIEYNPRYDQSPLGPLWGAVEGSWWAKITTTNEQYPVTYDLEFVSWSAPLSSVWPNLKSGGVYIHTATFKIPETVPEHLYDIEVGYTWNVGPPTPGYVALSDSQPHGLQVVDEYKTDFNFCQLSDIHVFGPENPNASFFYSHSQHERSARTMTPDANGSYGARYYSKTIQQVNQMNPDFVIFTGDYDFGQRYFTQNNGAWGTTTQYEYEMLWFYQETLALKVPVFIVIGNHDGYYEGPNGAQEDWFDNWKKLYGPLYFSFDYGDAHFTMINTMDWASADRILTNWLGVILQPEKYKGQVLQGGDAFEDGYSQARFDQLNEANYSGQLRWIRDDLIAHQSASIRICAYHHDPWKDAGSGSMWAGGGWLESAFGMLNMGEGDGRLALLKLMKDHRVALALSGHDHSDIVGSLAWTDGTGTTIHANTTSTSFQADGDSTSYPGYRRVYVSGGQVVTYCYPDNGNAPYSAPTYHGCNIGGTTDLTTLSTPAFETGYTQTQPHDATWSINNHLQAHQNNCLRVFPMEYLSDGYYYQVSNGTFGDRWDNNPEGSPTRRMHNVYTSVLPGGTRSVRVQKSASPDLTGPTGSVAINNGAASTATLGVTLNITASDAASGLRDMMVSNDPSFAGAKWQKYRTSLAWTLAAGAQGERTVYVKFRDWAMPENQSTVNDTIIYGAPASPPTVTSITPATGAAGSAVQVTDLHGTGFYGAPEVELRKSGQPSMAAANVVVQSANQISCRFDLPFDAASGTWNVRVQNPDGQSGTGNNLFTVTYDAPTVITVVPAEGLAGQSVPDVNITGTGFRPGVSVKLRKSGAADVNALNVNRQSSTQIVCELPLPAAGPGGAWDVVVQNSAAGGGKSGTKAGGFNVLMPPPTVTGITPASGGDGETVIVTNLAGQHFVEGATVRLQRAGQEDISASDVNVVNSTRITCRIALPAGAQAGAWDVRVTNPDAQSALGAGLFTVINYPPPSVIAIDPDTAENNAAVEATVSGTGFRPGLAARLRRGGDTITATGIKNVDDGSFECLFDVGARPVGAWDVEVQNADGKSAIGPTFTLTEAPDPTFVSITPTAAAVGDTVTLTGTNFGSLQSGASYVEFGNVSANVSEWTDTAIKCLVPVGARSGGVSLTVAGKKVGSVPFTLYNTPRGTNVTVDPADGVRTVFAKVTTSGHTTAAEGNAAETRGFQPVTGTRHTISTTAVHTGKVTLTIEYGNSFIPADIEPKLVIIQRKGNAWKRYPSTVSAKANKVTAVVEGLGDFAVAAPLENTTWYLAEGTSDWGFTTYVNIQNPNANQATARVTYMTGDGEKTRPDIVLPAMSQTVINPANDIGATDFSTQVVCVEELPIAVDRRMIWVGPGAAASEGHASVGVTAPDAEWYLPEGSSKWGFETWLLVQNPNAGPATCEITYMTEGAGPMVATKTVPPKSRASFNMADDIGAQDASIKVKADRPVIPERAMYRHNRREGHDSVGTTRPAKNYYLAEGTTGYGFTTFVLIQNPGATEAKVTVTYMTNSGPVERNTETMQPHSRKTINVNSELPGEDLSIRVQGDQPIIAERAMYWSGTAGEACHDSIGMPEAHTTFLLPDGETYNGHETWTLVQNPNPVDVKVDITYMTVGGTGNKTLKDQVIPSNSRRTFFMADTMGESRAAILVTCRTSGRKIMVERAMYWDNRNAGTDTIGGYAD